MNIGQIGDLRKQKNRLGLGLRKLIMFCCLLIFAWRLQADTLVIGPGFTETELANTHTWKTGVKSRDIPMQFTLRNVRQQMARVYLSVINPTIDLIDVSVQDNNGKTDTFRLGDALPFPDRLLKHYNLVLPLELAPGSVTRVTLLVHTQLEPLNLKVELSEQKTFIKRTNHDNLFMGAFYGIFFMFMLLLFCFYIFSKSKFFIIYFFINLVTLLFFMLYNGTGYQYVWFYSSLIQQLMPVFLATCYLTAHAYFIRSFFNVEIRYIRFSMIINAFLVLSVSVILFSLVQLIRDAHWNVALSDYYWVIRSLFVIYGLLVLGISLYTYLKTAKREASWVFVGASIQFFNWIIFIENIYGSAPVAQWLGSLQLFPSHLYIPHLCFVLIAAEIFVISYFITVNYHTLIRQNDISAKRLHFLQQRNINTFILGQEETRENITRHIENSLLSDIRKAEEKTRRLLNLENQARISSILQDFQHTINDLNNITSNYVAPDMQNIDLRTLIRTALDKLALEKQVECDFNEIYKAFTLNANANTHLYRVLQEVSNNILKHARADKVQVQLQFRNKHLRLTVQDDGVGMSDNAATGKGIGLINIESRIRSLNGNFSIEQAEPGGTAYIFELPIRDIT